MDSRNGALAAFDRDNTRELLYRMPFSDFGAMIDPPTEDVTAHVLEMLAATRRRRYASGRRARPGVSSRDADVRGARGTDAGASTTSTERGASSRALTALRAGSDMVERAAAWLIAVQNADGGWGESCHSYVDESFAGIGRARASQTAWAVIALQLAGYGATSRRPRGSCAICASASGRRDVGRAGVHRHRLSARLLHQLPSLSPSLSRRWRCDDPSDRRPVRPRANARREAPIEERSTMKEPAPHHEHAPPAKSRRREIHRRQDACEARRSIRSFSSWSRCCNATSPAPDAARFNIPTRFCASA